MSNQDRETVAGFGDEWQRFDQTELRGDEHSALFQRYFAIFPWNQLPAEAEGFDMGCGSGRWAQLVAPKVGRLHCIDPSAALDVARRNLEGHGNCVFHAAGVGDDILQPCSMDFGYSLGVLHHVPDPHAGIAECAKFLKPGAPFLLYLYYAFDNRPLWFRALWKLSDWIRRVVSRLPHGARYWVSQLLALVVYWPLARLAAVAELAGFRPGAVERLPLAFYRHLSFYTMRTDALDRFGTRLEQRFTRGQIASMMKAAGLDNVQFSQSVPFWCAVGFRRE
jgi:SAM-dependent methyltransferase